MKLLENFLNGFLGASAILISPILWVFNLIIALKYFYIFPIILLGFRFIRYLGMGLLYVISSKSDTFKDGLSSNLQEQLENFKDYVPTWNLLGFDLLKACLNFSSDIIPFALSKASKTQDFPLPFAPINKTNFGEFSSS